MIQSDVAIGTSVIGIGYQWAHSSHVSVQIFHNAVFILTYNEKYKNEKKTVNFTDNMQMSGR